MESLTGTALQLMNKRNICMKKRLSVLLSVFLLCGVLFPAAGSFAFIPANASKAAPGVYTLTDTTVGNGYHLLVNGQHVTDSALSVPCGAGTAVFDPKTNTLTLTNAELTKSMSPGNTYEKNRENRVGRYAVISTDLPLLTVAVKGKNIFDSIDDDIRAYGDLRITGDGAFVKIGSDYKWDPETERNEKVKTEVSPTIVAAGDVTFENAKLSKLNVYGLEGDWTSAFGGLTVKNSVLSEASLSPGGAVHIENSTLTGTSYEGITWYYPPDSMSQQSYEGTLYRGDEIRCGDCAVTVTDSHILHSSIRTDGNISLKDSKVYNAGFTAGGTLTVQNITMEPGFSDPAIGLFATGFSAAKDLTFNGKNTLFNAALSGERLTIANTVLESSNVAAEGDLTLDGCEFYGTNFSAKGALLFKDTKADAKDKTQDSKIEFNGTRAEFINCDFGGIAETLKGERQVAIGNGIPMVESFTYNTLTGVSIFVWLGSRPEGDAQPTILFKNSRLIMSKILTYTPEMKLTVDETRLMLCAGQLSYQDYDYDKNVTVRGNIDIVTGYWGSDNTTGIFIDYLGDYYTFDKTTGVVNIYNHYGAYGFRQDSSEYIVGEGYTPTARYADSVKKIVVGDETENPPYQWFRGFTHLEEVDLGDGITELQGGYPNYTFYGCDALEKITFGKGMEYIDFEMLTQCPNLKTVVIESEKLSDYSISEGRWGFQSYNPDVKIYVPASQVERFKAGFPHYKDQIFALDAVDDPTSDGFMPGDVDLDKQITAADARLALRKSVGLETYAKGSVQYRACDVDFDGNVSAADARLILRASVGLEDSKTWGK